MESGKPLRTQPDTVGASHQHLGRVGRVAAGQRFGSWTVLSTELSTKSGALYVRARCNCGAERDANLRFMETGRSTQCRTCATRERHIAQGHIDRTDPRVYRLVKRVEAWRQRCRNPKDRSWHNYGGRGIEYKFATTQDAVTYVMTHLPHETYLGVDIDREDNNGHYERGNLRLVSRRNNLLNKRGSNTISWRGETIPTSEWRESPYSLTCTMRYAAQGLSGEDILRRAEQAVSEKRKNWRTIAAKLASTTS